MSKCDFNKVALQLYLNHTLAYVFSNKFAAYFQNTSEWLLLHIDTIIPWPTDVLSVLTAITHSMVSNSLQLGTHHNNLNPPQFFSQRKPIVF